MNPALDDLCEQDDPEMLEMFQRRLGVRAMPSGATFIAWRDAHLVQGGFMYERYTGVGGVVHLHWATDTPGRWLNRSRLQLAFAYPFLQLGVAACIGDIPASATRTRRLCEKSGGREIATISGYFPDDDLVLYRISRADCRWLPLPEEMQDGQA